MDGPQLEPQFADAFNAWKQRPDKQSMGHLLQQVRPVIDTGVAKNVGKQVSPVLRSSARKLAIGAIRSYDPNKAKLSTHIINHMQGLRRIGRQQQNIIRVPERIAIDQTYLRQAEAEIEDRLGREATTSELADHTGISMRRIEKIRRYKPPVYEGSLLTQQSAEMDPGLPAVDQDRGNYTLRAVYDDLDSTNQQIVEWTLGLYGKSKLSNQQIASKLRMTPGAVSQRKALIQQRIDEMEQLEH
jgi:DNA-directed RNA polymerase specialized sigma subunit